MRPPAPPGGSDADCCGWRENGQQQKTDRREAYDDALDDAPVPLCFDFVLNSLADIRVGERQHVLKNRLKFQVISLASGDHSR